MTRLRTRLVAAFLASTLVPFAATVWITTSLLDRSLRYATTGELDRLSRTLETTAKQFYQRERETLGQEARAGRVAPTVYAGADQARWPEPVRVFWASGETERFAIAGPDGDRVEFMRRSDNPPRVELYSRDLGGVRMQQLSTDLAQTRRLIGRIDARDLRRGFTLTLLLLLAAAWLVSLLPLVFIANRVSRPVQQLTAALAGFAGGDWARRIETGRPAGVAARDEVGRAVDAFNDMAAQLEENRDRLVHLTRMASWQSVARKTAHELKNSLTPIRLTVEEMQARQPADRAFMEQAVQIVVSEIESLERRVKAFSEFAAEPPIHPEDLDVNAVVAERVALLRPAHPGVTYDLRPGDGRPRAHASPDMVNGILTNLLQNAAEATGPGGTVRVTVRAASPERVWIEVHDSGPGLSADLVERLFEPTITFKKHGMGLGLSIAKKNALLSGGDVTLVPSDLGGAAFRVTLPS